MDQSAPQLIDGPARRTIIRWAIIAVVALFFAGAVAPIMIRAQVTTGSVMGSDAYAAWFTFHGTALMFPFIVSLAGLHLSVVRAHSISMQRFEFLDIGAFGFVVLGLVALGVGAASGVAATGGWVGYAPQRTTIVPSANRRFGHLDVWALTIAAAGCAALLLSIFAVMTIVLTRSEEVSSTQIALRRGTTSFAVALGLMSPLFLLASGSLFWAIHGGATYFDFTSGGEPARWGRAVDSFSGVYHAIIAIPALTAVCWLARNHRRPSRWLDRLEHGAFVILGGSPLFGWLALNRASSFGDGTRFPVPLAIFALSIAAVILACGEGLYSSVRLGCPEGWASVATLGLYLAHVVVSGWTAKVFADYQQLDTQIRVGRDHLLYLGGPVLGTMVTALILWPRLTRRDVPAAVMTTSIATYSVGALTFTVSTLAAGLKGMPVRMYRSEAEFGYGHWVFVGNVGLTVMLIAIGIFVVGFGLSKPRHSNINFPPNQADNQQTCDEIVLAKVKARRPRHGTST